MVSVRVIIDKTLNVKKVGRDDKRITWDLPGRIDYSRTNSEPSTIDVAISHLLEIVCSFLLARRLFVLPESVIRAPDNSLVISFSVTPKVCYPLLLECLTHTRLCYIHVTS